MLTTDPGKMNAIKNLPLFLGHKTEPARLRGLLAIILLFPALQLSAATIKWAATGSAANWNGTASNWTPACATNSSCAALLSGNSVVVDASAGATQKVSNDNIAGALTLNSLTVGSTFNVNVSAVSTLNIGAGSSNAGTFAVGTGGTLNINGAFTNSGALTNNNGTLNILGNVTNTGGSIKSGTYGSSTTAVTVTGGTITGSSSGVNATFGAGVTQDANGTLTAKSGGGSPAVAFSGTNQGTLQSGSGDLTMNGATNSGAIKVGGAGNVTIAGNLTNTGSLTGTSGTFTGTFTINGGVTVNTQGGSLGGAITNNGTINGGTIGTVVAAGRINGGTYLGTFNNRGEIDNGTFGNGTTAALVANGTVGGNSSAVNATFAGASGITNTGTLTANTAAGKSVVFGGPGGSTNTGTLAAGTGALQLTGTLNNTGGVVNGGTSGVAFQSTGQINNGTVSGKLTATGGKFNNVQFQNASLTGGTITGSGGTATGTNTITSTAIQSGAVLAINAGATTFTGSSTNAGTVDVASGATLDVTGTLNGGSVDSRGITDVSGNLGSVVSPLSSFEEDAGSVNISGLLDAATANLLGGTLGGLGSLLSTTVNNGAVSNAAEGLALTEDGTNGLQYGFANYNQYLGGAYAIDIGAPGVDELAVTNQIKLGSATPGQGGALELFNAAGNPFFTGLHISAPETIILMIDQSHPVIGTFTKVDNGTSALASLPPRWSIVYNGTGAPAGGGDVELHFAGAPEPGTEMLIGAGILAFALLRKRVRR